MFTARLFEFQTLHEENLLRRFEEQTEVVLSAPTGSGKTVLVSKFIDDYLDERPDTVFLWICPGAGGLEKQSQTSFREVTSGISDGDVYDFINESNPRGKVYFIDWEKINRDTNVVLREGERRDLMSKVMYCHTNQINIFMVIDEEHRNREAANEYINNMQPFRVLRISATPVPRNDDCTEKISDEEVIGEGLIAAGISINEGLNEAIRNGDNTDDDLRLLSLADEKRIEIEREYNRLGLNIKPLVLIQFPNGSTEWIERVTNRLCEMGYGPDTGLTTSWFTDIHPDNPDEIRKLDGKYAFVLFKQAIATGWDCPRAKILVKLREGGTETFNIQTVGRIRRMPERRHYDNPLLDNCYVYTLDNRYVEGLTSSMTNSFYTYLYKKKREAPGIRLTKESMGLNDRNVVNPEEIVNVVRNKMLTKYDNNHDGKLERNTMETGYGYVFGTVLKTEAFQGVARTTHDMLSLNRIFGGEHEISNHDDGFIIRDAKRRIARALGIDENISNNVLRILFGPIDHSKQTQIFSKEEIEFERSHKLIDDFSLNEFNAFLVNNRDRLVELFDRISAEEIANIIEIPSDEKEWGVPQEQYYKHHKRIEGTQALQKNFFEKYENNILIQPNRSCTEIEFERWCESYDLVEWVYKNGDKGSEFFSIVYRKAVRRANFYPDYIVKMRNGDIWIIEAKGGMTLDGGSNNVDEFAQRKFEALKEYGERHPEIKWGFVRAVGTQIYFSNISWDENVLNRNVWVCIEDVIK